MNQHQPDDRKVVIIGAGIAGLAAAKYLLGYDLKDVVILEAQAEIGGRIKTDRGLGFPFDQGASWIHGPKGNPLSPIAEAAAATTFLDDDENIEVYDVDGTVYTPVVLENEEERYEEILEEMEGDPAVSFGETFYQQYPEYAENRLWTYMLSAFLEFDTGGDIFRLSSVDFYDDEEFRGDDLMIIDGYDQITNYLAQGVEIRLNNGVNAIDYSGDKTIITTNDTQYVADHVIVTVPLGVLKKELIAFEPALPQNVSGAIDRLEMGIVNKFLLSWDTCFWSPEVQYIGYTPEEKGKFNFFLNTRTFSDTNALITFAFGDYAKQTEQMSEQEVVSEIIAHLQVIYGDSVPPPKAFLRTRWGENQYTYGSYSFATNGARSSDFNAFLEPINNKILFAGEHTILPYRGTAHGAYLSGLRAAKTLLKIKPN